MSDSTPNIKSTLHPRNKNRNNYQIDELIKLEKELQNHLTLNKVGEKTINFSDPKAVKLLNKALLKQNYQLTFWDFPAENLCPPIPGRADYLHYIADLLSQDSANSKKQITGLDIGTGATAIYPIIGTCEYGWKFVGTDVDQKSIISARNIVYQNEKLIDQIQFRLQQKSKSIFDGIIFEGDYFEFTMCNPPFHASAEEALKGSQRKVKNLTGKNQKKPVLNFAGNPTELIYEGGEIAFIRKMIFESKYYAKQCGWFTTLVSKQEHLHKLKQYLENNKVSEYKIIEMGTSNKTTRILAWRFNSDFQPGKSSTDKTIQTIRQHMKK